MDADKARRDLLKAIAAGTGVAVSRVLLPSLWATPLISAVSLPAHAAASGTQMTGTQAAANPITSVTPTKDAAGKISVTITIKPPTEVLGSPPVQFELYETLGTTTKVVGSFVPTTPSTPVTIVLIRDAGSYSYQVKWPGGFGAPFPAVVQ